MLQCHVKGCKQGYPLQIKVSTSRDAKQESERDFNPEFLERMFHRIDWTGLLHAKEALGIEGDLPATAPDEFGQLNASEQQTLHHLLMEVEMVEGELVCPGCGLEFRVRSGIPDMRLPEDSLEK
eukprot:Clim_evm18s14 gene=Clim_evmTU18s14